MTDFCFFFFSSFPVIFWLLPGPSPFLAVCDAGLAICLTEREWKGSLGLPVASHLKPAGPPQWQMLTPSPHSFESRLVVYCVLVGGCWGSPGAGWYLIPGRGEQREGVSPLLNSSSAYLWGVCTFLIAHLFVPSLPPTPKPFASHCSPGREFWAGGGPK